jgi:UDP-glucuronate 4-epimerase
MPQDKILITGTAGFIGFHLAKRLLAEGYNVVGLDNINDYYDVKSQVAGHWLEETGISRRKEKGERRKEEHYGIRADYTD